MKISIFNVKLSASMVGVAVLLAACGYSEGERSRWSAASSNRAKVSTYLTDAPNEDLKEVFVNVEHVEIWVEGQGKAGRIIKSQGLGLVDLLKLRNGALLPLNDLNLPADTMVKKFRILLRSEGHYATRLDGSRCDLQTPSAEKTGLKINLNEGLLLLANSAYTLVIDFDAKKSVVQKGNGGCLLKPVLKLKSAIQHQIDDSINETLKEVTHENELPPGENLIDNVNFDNVEDSVTDGFDYSDPTTWPKDMTEEEFNALF